MAGSLDRGEASSLTRRPKAAGVSGEAAAKDSMPRKAKSEAAPQAVWSSGVAFYPPSRKYWRIGKKWYDFEPFLKLHPGGEEVLLLLRDRFEDCTFAFEAHHHNFQKARAIIRKYEVAAEVVEAEGLVERPAGGEARFMGAAEPPKLLGDDAFYSVLRRRTTEYLRDIGYPDGGPTLQCKLLFWALFAGWLSTSVLTYHTGWKTFAVLQGLMATWVGAFGHNWVHQPRYRIWAYFSLDIIGFSSNAWYREHNLQHHMFTNTPWDNHFKGTDPFLVTDPTVERNWIQSRVSPYLHPLILGFGLYGNYLINCVELCRGREVFSLGKLAMPLHMACLISRWGSWGFWLHVISTFVLGNYYFTIALINHNTTNTLDTKARNDSQDWAVAQLRSSADWSVNCSFLSAGRWLWLNFHTVHHVFPLVDFSHHPAIQSILVKTCQEFGIKYECEAFGTLYLQMVRSWAEPMSHMENILVYAGGI